MPSVNAPPLSAGGRLYSQVDSALTLQGSAVHSVQRRSQTDALARRRSRGAVRGEKVRTAKSRMA